jgi:hypothetical protein
VAALVAAQILPNISQSKIINIMHYSTTAKNTTVHYEGEILKTSVEVYKSEEKVHVSVLSKHNPDHRLDLWLDRHELKKMLETHFPAVWERSNQWEALVTKVANLYNVDREALNKSIDEIAESYHITHP